MAVHLERLLAEAERLLPPGSLQARFAKGTLWSLAGIIISQGLTLLAAVIAARLLGRVGFGELGMIQSTVGMLGVFTGMALGLTATKYVAELRASDPERTGRVIGLTIVLSLLTGGLVAGLVYYTAPIVAAKALSAPGLSFALRVGTLLLFWNAIAGAQEGVLAGFEAFHRVAQVNLVVGVITLPLLTGGVILGGLPGGIWGLALAAAGRVVAGQMLLRRECSTAGVRISYRGFVSEWPIIFKFSAPAILSGALVSPVGWAANAMLARQPRGYGELGVLNAALQMQRLLTFFPGLLAKVAVPILSSMLVAGRRRESKRLVGMTILISAAVAAPVLLVLLMFSGPVMGLFGDGFASRGLVLKISALTAALVAAQTPVGSLLAASGRMWLGSAMNGGWGAVLLASAWFALERGYGAEGVAGAYLLAYICHSAWLGHFSVRVLRATQPAEERDGRPARERD